jgi:hypothetical protein
VPEFGYKTCHCQGTQKQSIQHFITSISHLVGTDKNTQACYMAILWKYWPILRYEGSVMEQVYRHWLSLYIRGISRRKIIICLQSFSKICKPHI